MVCQFCGKHIDEVDCSCGWCTICGWQFDVKSFASTEKKEESPKKA